MTFRPDIRIFADRRALATALSSHVAQAAETSSATRGRFCIALSGGSLIETISPVLSTAPLRDRIDWSAWHVFWADERWVPPISPDSNVGLARRLLFSRVGVPEEHIHAVDASKSPDEAAQAYASEMRKVFQVETGAFPRFDLILLGLGEDGHTASLFPGHPVLLESRRWVVPVFNAPKPPPVRVTITLPVINAARRVVFMAAGAEKAAIVSKTLDPAEGQPKLPVQMVRPSDGDLHWFIDQPAFDGTEVQTRFTAKAFRGDQEGSGFQ